jgi:hypothetical protein
MRGVARWRLAKGWSRAKLSRECNIVHGHPWRFTEEGCVRRPFHITESTEVIQSTEAVTQSTYVSPMAETRREIAIKSYPLSNR